MADPGEGELGRNHLQRACAAHLPARGERAPELCCEASELMSSPSPPVCVWGGGRSFVAQPSFSGAQLPDPKQALALFGVFDGNMGSSVSRLLEDKMVAYTTQQLRQGARAREARAACGWCQLR